MKLPAGLCCNLNNTSTYREDCCCFWKPIYFLELISGKICYDFYDQPQRTSQIPYRLANIGAIGEPIKARLCNPVVHLAIVRRGRIQPCEISEKFEMKTDTS